MSLMTKEDRYVEIEPIKETFQDGDIIFQTSKSNQSKAIQLATKSRYSHMGIIYFQKGKPFVFEATQPVKITPLQAWINRGEDALFVVKRLKNADKILTPKAKLKMKQIGEEYEGRNYDIYFGWSDDKIYCSELVWKIYKRACGIEVGKLGKLKDFDLTSGPVKAKLAERYGNKIPLEELVISPERIYQSDKLITVFKN